MKLFAHIAAAASCLRLQPSRNHPAFTLVEMSLVIAIISLLVAGVLGGTSLLQRSHLMQDIKSINSFLSATSSFKDKFKALPGNFANAYSYFGVTCGTNDVGNAGSCNGGGNGH